MLKGLLLGILCFIGIAAADCPVCQVCNCLSDPSVCLPAGSCSSNGQCECQPGYTGTDCTSPVCSASLYNTTEVSRLNGALCNCQPGWIGFQCLVCTDDEACNITDSAEGTICDQSGYTISKSYRWCEIHNEEFENFLGGPAYASYSYDAVNDLMFFQVLAHFYENAGYSEQFYCQSSDCTMTLGTNSTVTVSCTKTFCECYTHAYICGVAWFNFAPIVAQINDTLQMTCVNETCEFIESILSGLIGPIYLTCQNGECGVPKNATVTVEENGGPIIGGVIGGIVFLGIFSFLVILFLLKARDQRVEKKIFSEYITGEYLQTLLIGSSIKHFSFYNVCFTIGKNDKTTEIVSGVSGSVESGQLLGILGSSGAGKTTTLDIMARKNKSGKTTGDILVDGQRSSKKDFIRISGYVDQETNLLTYLTVQETIFYACRLRLPSSVSYEEKLRRVVSVMAALRIDHVAHKRIGSVWGPILSGGEKRRVSIACELVNTPAILFLDEPTTGLDSFSAFSVIETLKNICIQAKMIAVLTVHQPRSNTFALFDKLLLLTKGKMYYSGSLAESEAYFQKIGFPCPVEYNPADHYLDIASTLHDLKSGTQIDPREFSNQSTALAERQELLAENFQSSSEHEALNKKIQEFSTKSDEEQMEKPAKHINIFEEMYVLSGRIFISLYRDPLLLISHYTIAILLGVFVGGLFWKVQNTLAGLQDSLGYIFFTLAVFGFGSLSLLGTSEAERNVFKMERSNGYYRPISYFVTKVIFDNVPLRIIPPILFAAISYFMVGFNPSAASFFKFLLPLVLFNLTAGNFVLLFACLVQNKGVANLLASLLVLFSLMFSGFLINKDDIPPVLRWVQYLSFFNYAFESMAVNQLNGIVISDKVEGDSFSFSTHLVLVKFGFNTDFYWPDIAILAGFCLFYLIAAFLALQFLVKERK